MKKDNLWLWIALGTVVIIAFNVFFFALSADNKPASVWVNYVFITFSYIVLMLTPVLAGELTVKNNKRHLLYYGTFHHDFAGKHKSLVASKYWHTCLRCHLSHRHHSDGWAAKERRPRIVTR